MCCDTNLLYVNASRKNIMTRVGSYTALRMPSTANSRISEMAVVGQTLCCILLDICFYFKTYWSVLLFISTYSFVGWNEICNSKIGPINISRILFAVEPDQRKSSTDYLVPNGEFIKILTFNEKTEKKRHLALTFQSWKMPLDHTELHPTLAKRLHID